VCVEAAGEVDEGVRVVMPLDGRHRLEAKNQANQVIQGLQLPPSKALGPRLYRSEFDRGGGGGGE
jgi:hypothetical protein